MKNLAIFAGRGVLPEAIYARHSEALVVSFGDAGIDFHPTQLFQARYEKTGALFRELKKRQVKNICFAGKITRPELKILSLDFKTIRLLPQVRRVLKNRDGQSLLLIRTLVEQEGYRVIGAHQLLPEWVAPLGKIGAVSPPKDLKLDVAINIHEAMSVLDIGQALVMKGTHCWAIETLPGTQAMLEFIATHDEAKGGYLYKASKIGQDLDMDMASIGSDTVAQAKAAGLKGIVVGAHRSFILDMPKTIAAADAAGLFLLGV